MDATSTAALSHRHASRFIYITGCDGTGKTTQARLLIKYLQSLGVRPQHLWLRFPFLLSLPLLAFARWWGYSWYEEVGGARHGYWNFRGSWILRTMLPWALFLDAALASLIRVYVPLWLGRTIVCERFVLDMLADLMVAFDDLSLHCRIPGRLYLWLVPYDSVVVVLNSHIDTIRMRRAELRSDRYLDRRLEVFQRLAADLGFVSVHSDLAPKEVSQQLWRIAGNFLQAPRKYYGVSHSHLLRPLLSNPVIALCIHWFFQGITYLDRTERLFKLGLDFALICLLAPLLRQVGLNWLWATALAFWLAHTLSFLVNGQVWVVLKHFGLVRHAREAYCAYLNDLALRLKSEPSIIYAAAYGSLAREVWSPSSDLDVRLVRRAGLGNAMRACVLALKERFRATTTGFPLDLYVLDSAIGLSKLRKDEEPFVLIDRAVTS